MCPESLGNLKNKVWVISQNVGSFWEIGKIVSIDLYERKVLRKKFAEVCL
jgi:hypothetical protein